MLIAAANAANWDAISAITNIVLSVFTLSALLLTLITVRVTSFPKGKLMLQNSEKSSGVFKMKFVNNRNVPITIIHRGFYLKQENGRKPVLVGKSKITKLEWTDVDYFESDENTINNKLIELGYPLGKKIEIVGFFMTSSNKKYIIKICHRISEKTDGKITLNLNKQWITKELKVDTKE